MAKYIDVDSLRFPNICIFDMTLHGDTVPMVRLADLQKLVPAADVVDRKYLLSKVTEVGIRKWNGSHFATQIIRVIPEEVLLKDPADEEGPL